MLKVNNRNTRTRCEICSKLTIKTPERRQWRRSGVFIVNFEHISHLVLMFLLLTLVTSENYVKNLFKKHRHCQEYQINFMILKKNLLFNAAVKSQFNNCILASMFCLRTSSNMINKVHERALRVILGDDLSEFESLLQSNKDICSHHKNIQIIMIEMFETKNELAPATMDSMFERRIESYNLRNFQEFLTERKRTVHYVLETLSYRSPQLWSILPENIKEVESLEIFERKVKNWICDDFPCRLCKAYLQNNGFL